MFFWIIVTFCSVYPCSLLDSDDHIIFPWTPATPIGLRFSIMSSEKLCCVPNCGSEKGILHKFPNPNKEPERFRTWIYNIGGSVLALDNDMIFKRRRVCHLHFEARYHTRSKFLSADAIPRLCLPGNSIVRKWSNMRDSYMKSLHNKPGQLIRKKYMYAENMTFLMKNETEKEDDVLILSDNESSQSVAVSFIQQSLSDDTPTTTPEPFLDSPASVFVNNEGVNSNGSSRQEKKRKELNAIKKPLLEESQKKSRNDTSASPGELILNKWTNIRDTFIKSLKTKMGRPKKKYLLYNHLEFLTKIIPESERHTEIINSRPSFMKQEEPDSGFSITAEIEPESSTSFTISKVTSFGTKKSVKGSDFDDAKSTDYASEVSYGRKSNRVKKKSNRFIFVDDTDSVSSKKKSKKSSINDDVSVSDQFSAIDFVEVDDNDPRIMNEDEAFFASLLPTVVKYTEDERLEFRIEVLGVMKKLKEKRTWVAE